MGVATQAWLFKGLRPTAGQGPKQRACCCCCCCGCCCCCFLGPAWVDVGVSWGLSRHLGSYASPSCRYVGAMLAHLGGYVGPSWRYLGPSWGHVGPYVGPCWGYVAHVSQAFAHDADEAPRCGTHFQHYLGLCWAMLTHLEPQSRKNGRSRKHCKAQYFWRVGGGGDGLPSLLRRGEIAYGKDTARGPWPDLRAYARQPARGPSKGMVAVVVVFVSWLWW